MVGKLPFFGEFEADLFRKIQSGKHMPLPTDIGSTKVRGLLSQIFTVDPKMRINAEQVSLIILTNGRSLTTRGCRTKEKRQNLQQMKIEETQQL